MYFKKDMEDSQPRSEIPQQDSHHPFHMGYLYFQPYYVQYPLYYQPIIVRNMSDENLLVNDQSAKKEMYSEQQPVKRRRSRKSQVQIPSTEVRKRFLDACSLGRISEIRKLISRYDLIEDYTEGIDLAKNERIKSVIMKIILDNVRCRFSHVLE